MDGIKQNKAEWVRKVLHEFEGPLIRYATSIVKDTERAKDVVQETFMRLCAEDPKEIEGHLSAWIFTVCRNKAFDVYRKENRMIELCGKDLEACESRELSPPQRMEKEEQSSQVLRLLESLPPNQQEVLRLKFQSGLSYKEISHITGLSVSNVGFLIHSGVKNLRGKIQKELDLPTY